MTSFATALVAGWALSLAIEDDSLTALIIFFVNAYLLVVIPPRRLKD